MLSKVLAVFSGIANPPVSNTDGLLEANHNGLGVLPYADSGGLDLGMVSGQDFCHRYQLSLSGRQLSDCSNKLRVGSAVRKEK